jgi:hypothetical protein
VKIKSSITGLIPLVVPEGLSLIPACNRVSLSTTDKEQREMQSCRQNPQSECLDPGTPLGESAVGKTGRSRKRTNGRS